MKANSCTSKIDADDACIDLDMCTSPYQYPSKEILTLAKYPLQDAVRSNGISDAESQEIITELPSISAV
jgi:hypothetical protein